MLAAILLEDETRDAALDADLSHGSLHKPLHQVLAMTRGFVLQKTSGVPLFVRYFQRTNWTPWLHYAHKRLPWFRPSR